MLLELSEDVLYREYIKSVSRAYYAKGHAEFTNRTELHNLLNAVLAKMDVDVRIDQEQRAAEYGRKRPDFIVVERVGSKLIGSIETKKVGKRLDDKRYKNQIDLYSKRYPMIFTNYVTFQLIVENEILFEITNALVYESYAKFEEDFKMMFEKFFVFSI